MEGMGYWILAYCKESVMSSDEILIYKSNGDVKIDVILVDETVWLSQAQLCILFLKSKSTISEHIKNRGLLCKKVKLFF
jgi:hypothetical protein